MGIRRTAHRLDDVDVIDTTVAKTYRWIDELNLELGGPGRREAYRVMRGFLQTVRDRLTVDQAAELASQLPMLVRGIYYEGWVPSRAPIKMKAEEFVELFIERAVLPADHDALAELKVAARVMRRHVTPGEANDTLINLPHDIQQLLS
jgi:uncharacterized protein (DUF2267 family)